MNNSQSKAEPNKPSLNFLEQIIESDLRNNTTDGRILTRFPPEPNGHLHIGHAKSICLNFGLAQKYNGKTNLRFDDTNPTKESTEYVNAIKEDVHWLGFQWEEPVLYASDYFDQLYEYAVYLIRKGKAFVCDMSAEEMSEGRGTPQIPGVESPWRNRSVEENLDLLERMKNGEFANGKRVLRAKIDMSSPNMHMRDPVMYRIMHAHHHRTGNKWCIYPTYDWAHGQSDYIEGITHSICTLEFVPHRALYDWFLENLDLKGIRPHQYEFARLNLTYTVMSKRKLLQLVEEKHVKGWDDPRMPTVSGLRRRGYTPASIRVFADKVGVAKRENVIDLALLEYCIREDLNRNAARVMAVLDPVKLIIDNYPEGQTENLPAKINPEDENSGNRMVPFSREVLIERNDFMEDPPKKFFRLSPGSEVRLKYAYIIRCDSVEKDEQGKIKAIHCTYFPDTKSGLPSTRKVKSAIHWVSIQDAVEAEVRLYDRLFTSPEPDDVEEGKDFKDSLNPDSLKVVKGFIEPSVNLTKPGQSYQFERTGYFSTDPDSTPEKLVFNRTVTRRDSYIKKGR
ncbi:MAG: glutamine--tRNA ligase/YqeY domain fusion protein [Bacteroidota bacterium]